MNTAAPVRFFILGSVRVFNGLLCLALAGVVSIRADAACLSITNQPKSRTVFEGCPVFFSVEATGAVPFSIQWYWDIGQGAETVVAATNSVLELTPGYNESGVVFAVLTAGCGSVTSLTASVTVFEESVPPTLRRVTGVGNLVVASFDVGVCLTPYWVLDSESATNLDNYRLSGGLTIQSARLGCSGRDVLLEVVGRMIPETSYTLSVSGVMDRFGNLIDGDSRASFAAPAPADVPVRGLHISKILLGAALEWHGDGILQISRKAAGPWNDLVGASSPWIPGVSSPCFEPDTATGPFFFRVRWLLP